MENTANSLPVKSRLNWLDYAKGFGILFVLIAHALPADNDLNIWMYTFHLPLFFIISGVLLSNKTIEMPFKKVLKKYSISLLLPYYVIGAAVLIIELLKDFLQKELTMQSVKDNIVNFVIGAGLKADWFLPCLFIAIIINILLIKSIKRPVFVSLICLALSFVVIYIHKYTDIQFIIFQIIAKGIIASFFVSIGFVLRDKIKAINKVSNTILLSVIFFALTTAIAAFNGKISLLAFKFGKTEILFFIGGIIGSFFIFEVSKLLNEITIRPLLYCGKNSLFIMLIHMEIMAICEFGLDFVLHEKNIVYYLLLILMTLIITLIATPICKTIYKYIKSILVKEEL